MRALELVGWLQNPNMDGGGDTFNNNKPLSAAAADADAIVDNSSNIIGKVDEDDNNKKELAKRNCSSLPLCYDRVGCVHFYFFFILSIYLYSLFRVFHHYQ